MDYSGEIKIGPTCARSWSLKLAAVLRAQILAEERNPIVLKTVRKVAGVPSLHELQVTRRVHVNFRRLILQRNDRMDVYSANRAFGPSGEQMSVQPLFIRTLPAIRSHLLNPEASVDGLESSIFSV